MKQVSMLAVCAALALALGTVVLAGGIRVEVKHDKTFNFAGMKTYAWRLDGPNPVKLLVDEPDHDPAQIRKNVEPIILAAIDQALAKKGLSKVTTGQPDLFLEYYVLVGPNIRSQYQGQFVGAIPEWGLPDFAMSTSALRIEVQGSVIIDMISATQKMIVWRGTAEAELQKRKSDPERVAIMNDIAKRMLDKFPPKFEPGKK